MCWDFPTLLQKISLNIYFIILLLLLHILSDKESLQKPYVREFYKAKKTIKKNKFL